MSNEEKMYRYLWGGTVGAFRAVRGEVMMLGQREIGVRLDRVLKKADEMAEVISQGGVLAEDPPTPPVTYTVPRDSVTVRPQTKMTAVEQAELVGDDEDSL